MRATRPGSSMAGAVPAHAGSPIGFGMLLNLASVANADTPDILWGFIRRYSPDLTPETAPFLAKLVGYAVAYYQDFVRPKKAFRDADGDRAGGAGRSRRDLCAARSPPARRPRISRRSSMRSASGIPSRS